MTYAIDRPAEPVNPAHYRLGKVELIDLIEVLTFNVGNGEPLKNCSRCKKVKPLTDFYRSGSNKSGYSSHCRQCHSADVSRQNRTPEGRARSARVAKAKMLRPGEKEKRRERFAAYSRKKRYGLTEAAYQALLESQGSKCKVCKSDLDLGRHTHVDHCHSTGKVRGILCHRCNTSIGLACESPERLRALAAYLEAT